MKRTTLKTIIFSISLLICSSALSSEIDTILAEKEAPAGVVFEIVSDEPGLLADLLPSVKTDIEKLRRHFPDIAIAIVTHGTEQFDLTSKNRSSEQQTHELVEQLVRSDDIDVHVCGTHAGWYGVMPEDFPDYVDVTAAGPAQINDYEAMGYEVIILSE
jgi:intracellular sulfur oxidation DsrE/DsrF family protein